MSRPTPTLLDAAATASAVEQAAKRGSGGATMLRSCTSVSWRVSTSLEPPTAGVRIGEPTEDESTFATIGGKLGGRERRGFGGRGGGGCCCGCLDAGGGGRETVGGCDDDEGGQTGRSLEVSMDVEARSETIEALE